MLNLVKNELIKLHYKRKLLITVIVLFVVSILICAGTFALSKLATPKGQIKIYETNITNLENQKQNNKNLSEKDIHQIDKQIEDFKAQIETIKSNANNPNVLSWKDTVEAKTTKLEEQKAALDSFKDAGEIESINKELLINNYLLKNNIKPLGDFDFTSFSIVSIFFKLCSILLVCIIISIITADIISGECTPPTLKVLLSRPVARWKVLLSKFIAALVSSLIIIISIEVLLYLLGGLILGFQNMSYPMAVGTKFKESVIQISASNKSFVPIVGSTYIIPLWLYLLRTLSMQILFITASVSFFLLLSSLFKSSTLSMTLSIVLVIVLDIIKQLPFQIVRKISSFIFITYGNSLDLVGSKLSDYSLGSLNPLQIPIVGIIVLLCWSIGCYVIAHLVFTKKDILI